MSMAIIILIMFCAYMGFLFYLALQTEEGNPLLKIISEHSITHALALGIYCTTWTYYGGVGFTTRTGMLFLTIYLGPTCAIFFWGFLLKKMVRIKNSFRITSIADFISARYNRSQSLAAIVSLIALIGALPYIALQFKAISNTLYLVTDLGVDEDWIAKYIEWLVVALIILFTIMFGARRLDPTETHKGMVLSVAIQSVVQLGAMLLAGAFVTYFIFNGFGDVFDKLSHSSFRHLFSIRGDDVLGASGLSYLRWSTYLILAMSAIMFLPRQFHITVIENQNEEHVNTTMWVFPLYMFLMTIFVVPIAAGGLLKGLPLEQADNFVLLIPQSYGQDWLTVVVFFGGFSAAVSMIMITAMTLATMSTNHLLLPLIDEISFLNVLKRELLTCRWIFISVIIVLGYLSMHMIGESYMLVSIGIISFIAVLQFAPSIIGGLYWRGASSVGAHLGLCGGFVIWLYTSLLPSIIRSGWLPDSILNEGPFGITLLKPEALLGISVLDATSHTVFWSLFVNVSLYIIGSMIAAPSHQEKQMADHFVDVMKEEHKVRTTTLEPLISLASKKQRIIFVLKQYFGNEEAERILINALTSLNLSDRKTLTIIEFADLCAEIERLLAGSIGAASAHRVFKDASLFTGKEAQDLSVAYADILGELKVSPQEFKEKIDYYQERERIFAVHSREMADKIAELEYQIEERKKAEERIRVSEAHLQTILDTTNEGFMEIDNDAKLVNANPQMCELMDSKREEIIGRSFYDFVDEENAAIVSEQLEIRKKGLKSTYELAIRTVQGKIVDCLLNATPLHDANGVKIGSFALVTNISKRKQAEKELHQLKNNLEEEVKKKTSELVAAQKRIVQAERLAAIGELGGMIAHEFRNQLGILRNAAYYLKMKIKTDDPKVLRHLTIMEEEISKTNRIIEDILAFSRIKEVQYAHVDVRKIIEDTVAKIERARDSNVTVKTCFEEDCSFLEADAVQLGQIFANIISNAFEAMADEGTLFITVKRTDGMLCFIFEDTGPGLDDEVKERVFEPLFTTKARGTGFGLSTSKILIERHQGSIIAENRKEGGARFIVCLPQSAAKK